MGDLARVEPGHLDSGVVEPCQIGLGLVAIAMFLPLVSKSVLGNLVQLVDLGYFGGCLKIWDKPLRQADKQTNFDILWVLVEVVD